MDGAADPWSSSAQDWGRFLPPFRPHADDVGVVESIAGELAGGRRSLQVVTLGLTPEVIGCRWPNGTNLQAFDSSPEMMLWVWRSSAAPPGSTAICADWTKLPLADGAADLVTADGSLVCVGYPDGAARVLAEVRRVLRPGGRFIARTFLRPAEPEPMDEVLADLAAGRIGNAFVLKMRMGAVLHGPDWAGFSMHEKSKLWRRLFPDPDAVARAHGWSPATMAISTSYAVDDVSFFYPTDAELRALVARNFRVLASHVGRYELAERCPTLVLEPLT